MPVLSTQSAAARAQSGLNLYHHGLSSCSQRVRMALAELGLPWVSHLVDLRVHAHLTPEFLAINPRGLVPVLVDDGQVVIESIDILKHLDTVHGGGRLGGQDDPLLTAADDAQTPLKALTHEFMFRARGAPDPATLPTHPDPDAARFAREYHENGVRWQARIGNDTRGMAHHLAALDDRLAQGDWLGGGQVSLVDIAWMSTVHRLVLLGWPLETRLADWYVRIAARPSFDEAVTHHQPQPMLDGQAAYVARRRAERTAIGEI